MRPGEAVYTALLGRMVQTNDAIFQSSMHGGTPLIDAPTSWKYLQWKYEYDAQGQSAPPDDKRDVLISKALESRMLSGVPPKTLIELRRNGAAAQLREILRKGIEQMNSATDADVSGVAAAVIDNIDTAFSSHDQQLRELASSRNKFFGYDVGRYVIIGGTAIASPLVHSTALAVLFAMVKLAGTPSPADLFKKYRELRAREADLRRSPVAILFRHLKDKFGFSN
jgi:hypothetical protein